MHWINNPVCYLSLQILFIFFNVAMMKVIVDEGNYEGNLNNDRDCGCCGADGIGMGGCSIGGAFDDGGIGGNDNGDYNND